MSKEYTSFRKAAFGGFNRKDVISYIEKMRNESFEYKKQVEETVKTLNEKIRELENAAMNRVCTEKAEADFEAAEPVQDNLEGIGEATQHLKSVADEFSRSLGDFMDKLSEKGLFENEFQFICDEADEAEAEQQSDFVERVLSSISFSSENEKAAVPENEVKLHQIDIDELLSGLDFTV